MFLWKAIKGELRSLHIHSTVDGSRRWLFQLHKLKKKDNFPLISLSTCIEEAGEADNTENDNRDLKTKEMRSHTGALFHLATADCFNQLFTLFLSQHQHSVDWKHKAWLETTGRITLAPRVISPYVCVTASISVWGTEAAPGLAIWWGLVGGRSEAQRITLMWVKAIDRGPAQLHADSDLIAALQKRTSPRDPLGFKKKKEQKTSSTAKWELWMSSGITSHSTILWLDPRLAYGLWFRVKGFHRTNSAEIKAVSEGGHSAKLLLMWTFTWPGCARCAAPLLSEPTSTLTTGRISATRSIMGHFHCPCNGSTRWNAA